MFLACLLCASQFGMFAQDLTIPMYDVVSVIPSVLTFDSKAKIHSRVYSDYVGLMNQTFKIYNNELEEVASIEYDNSIDLLGIDILDISRNKIAYEPYESSVILTQTLFNEDEKWEYITPKYIDGIAGIDVKTEDGSIVYSLSFDKIYGYGSINLTLLLWDDKRYLVVTEDENYYTAYLYLVDKKNSSITKAKSLGSMKLYPSLAKKNSTVTVDIDDNTKMNGGILCITDMNGRVVYTRDVKIGESQLQIPIKRLSSGMYVVTLKSGNDSFEATKLIVR